MTVSDIDAAPRAWNGDEPGPIRIGSEQHKTLFSRMLLDTFNPYKPAVIDWPRLDAAFFVHGIAASSRGGGAHCSNRRCFESGRS